MIRAPAIVLAPFAGADKESQVIASPCIADLHVEIVSVKRDFPSDSNAALVAAHVILSGSITESGSKLPQHAHGSAVHCYFVAAIMVLTQRILLDK